MQPASRFHSRSTAVRGRVVSYVNYLVNYLVNDVVNDVVKTA